MMPSGGQSEKGKGERRKGKGERRKKCIAQSVIANDQTWLILGHGDTCPRCTAITDLHKHSETLGVSEFTYRLMIAVSMLTAVAVLLAAFLYLGQI